MKSQAEVRANKSRWIDLLGNLAEKAHLEKNSAVAVILDQTIRAIENDIEIQAAIVIRGFVDERLKRIQEAQSEGRVRRNRRG